MREYIINKYKIYGFFGMIKLIIFFIRTKCFFRRSRLIRFPITIRGRNYIDFGSNLTTGIGCRIEAFPYFANNTIIKFGNNVEINDYVHITGVFSVIIGNDVLIASKVYISDSQHGNYGGSSFHDSPFSTPNSRSLSYKPVIIEDNVWIGESVCILAGVTIGRGAVIGANSVVTKDIPEGTIAAGNPAKIIKKYNFDTNKWEKQ